MGSDQIRLVDCRHQGLTHVIGAWLVGEVVVDPGPTSCLHALVEGLGGLTPRALALTHIHLDHAGASGSLVRRWPDLEVWVHERGAPHLIDPSRLLASAERLYGDEMDVLWGEVAPVPEQNIRVLRGGEQIGPFEVAHTPGHASHHVSYWHAATRTAFVGDVAGVRIPPSEFVEAPTPPPDIDLEAWDDSLQRLRDWRPERLALTHFGAVEEPGRHLDLIGRELRRSSDRVREVDVDRFAAELRARVGRHARPADHERYELAVPPDQSWQGLARYWSKRELR